MDKWLQKSPKRAREEAVKTESDDEEGDEVVQVTPQNADQEPQHKLKRKFLPKWLADFKWAKYDASTDSVTCSCCYGHACGHWKATKWVLTAWKEGWTRKQLQQHDESDTHRRAIEAEVQRPKEALPKVSIKMTDNQRTALLSKLHTVHFAVKNLISQHRTTQLHQLIAKEIRFICSRAGVEVAIPTTDHASNWSTRQFSSALAKHVLNQLVEQLRSAPCFTIHIDESTDITATKKLLIYVQYPDVQKRRLLHQFFKIAELESTDAESITTAVLSAFQHENVDITKCVMCVSDGANVMMGVRNGVVARLKRVVPHIVEFHCLAHRQALSLGEAFDSLNRFVVFENRMRDLIRYLHTARHTAQLKKVGEAIGETITSVVGIFEIRWLSRVNVVRSLVRNLRAIQLLLQDASNREDSAVGLFKRVTSVEFQLVLHHLLDILVPLEVLCKQLQARNVHPLEAFSWIEQCIATLSEMYLSHGAVGGKCYQYIVTEFAKLENERDLIFVEGDGRRARAFDEIDVDVRDDVVRLITKIIDNLRDRTNTNSSVIQATKIFKPEIYHDMPPKELLTSGDDDLKFLLRHFNALLQVDEYEAIEEFLTAKRRMKTKLSWSEALYDIGHNNDLFPNLSKLAVVLLSFDASNAEIERGFSAHNNIKTKLRNRWTTHKLDEQMRILLDDTPLDEFDYDAALAIWSTYKAPETRSQHDEADAPLLKRGRYTQFVREVSQVARPTATPLCDADQQGTSAVASAEADCPLTADAVLYGDKYPLWDMEDSD